MATFSHPTERLTATTFTGIFTAESY